MTVVVKGKLRYWRRMNQKIPTKVGVVVSDDPKFGNVLVSEKAFRAGGFTPEEIAVLKNGDVVTVEVISHASRVFRVNDNGREP